MKTKAFSALLFGIIIGISTETFAQLTSLNEDFQTTANGTLPTSWQAGGWVSGQVTNIAVAGTNKGPYVVFNTTDQTISQSWLVAPKFDNLNNKKLQFSFINLSGIAQKVEVWVSDVNALNDHRVTRVHTINDGGTNPNKQTITVDLSNGNFPNTRKFIGWVFYEAATGNGAGVGIDDVVVTNAVNSAPTDISISSQSINENNAVNATVGILSTVDVDLADTHTYTVGGTDGNLFSINGNQLRANASFDVETKSSYSITITTNDGKGGSFPKNFTISVTNVNESPQRNTISKNKINRGSVSGHVVGILSTVDPDTNDQFTYELSGADASLFTLNGRQLKTNFLADANAKKNYSISVKGTDSGGLFASSTITLSINDAPTKLSIVTANNDQLDIFDISKGGATTGDFLLIPEDEAGERHTYSIVKNTNPPLAIYTNAIGTGYLQIPATTDFSTVSPDNQTVDVKVTDGHGLSLTKTFQVEIIRFFELDKTDIDENKPTGTVITTIKGRDLNTKQITTIPKKNILLAGADSDKFEINSSSQLVTKTSFDFETKKEYAIVLGLQNDNGTVNPRIRTIPFNITVNDVEESDSPDQVLSISDSNSQSLSVYPNPSMGFVNIKLQEPDQYRINISTVHGVKVQHNTFSGKEALINTSNLEKGIYLLQVDGTNTQIMQRLIIH